MPQLSDTRIVDRVLRGNSDAYELLIERYESKLRRYVTYLIGDEMTSHDVVQETFIKAYQNLRSYKPKYKFSSWIYRIAHNEAMNAVKKRRFMTSDDIETLSEVAYTPRPDEAIDRSILQAHVHGCLGELEPKYREVVQLVYFEHMKYDEVSDILHVPPSTVGVWLSRAKAKLRVLCHRKGVH